MTAPVTYDTFSRHLNYDGTPVEYTLEQHGGAIVRLVDDPQPSNRGTGSNVETIFDAIAYDQTGNQYRLVWEVTHPESDNEAEACDWDSFDATKTDEVAPWHPNYK